MDAQNQRTLASLPTGTFAKVTAIDQTAPAAKRLMEMGVVPGASVRVIKSAPFGCPMEIRVRGYNLALRRSEAGAVEVSE